MSGHVNAYNSAFARLQSALSVNPTQLVNLTRRLNMAKSKRNKSEDALLKKDDALIRINDQLRALAGMLFRAQDEERRRVSRELHDDLSQKIAHVEFNLDRLARQLPSSSTAVIGRLEVIRDQVAEFSMDLRRTAHRLHPSMLEHLDFGTVLRSYAAEFSERTKLPVKVKITGRPSSLAPEAGSSLYRIVQEALHNVHKHAGPAAAVRITVARTKAAISLSIEDTGVGFKAETLQKSHGLGLISMRERVLLLDGSFSMNSGPEKGVTIRIVVPVGILES